MIAGTLALLEELADEPLETETAGGTLPALDVRKTQADLDGNAVAQQGYAGGRVTVEVEDVMLAQSNSDDDDPLVVTERIETAEQHHTEWVADVTGHGLVLVASLGGDDNQPFPLDLISAQTGRDVRATGIDLRSLSAAWDLDDEQTWYVGDSDVDGTTLRYHDAAGQSGDANVGIGFERSWQTTGARGVVYESGYVAIYREWTPAVGIEFVAEEILPHAYEHDTEQTKLGESNA
jgi:hypothetical protein